MKTRYYIKNLFLLITLIGISIFLVSCEKVIDVDLNSSNPVLAVDGIMELDSSAWIKLSYTTDYFNNETQSYEENALVSISNTKGETELLTYQGEGIYKGANMLGNANETYTLKIEKDTDIYEANTELLGPTEIIGIKFEESIFSNPHSEEKKYSPIIKFVDDPMVKNYYSLKFWKNDTLMKTSYTSFEDIYFNTNDTIEYTPFALNFNLGDRFVVKVYSIDQETDKYYDQLNDIQDGGGTNGTPYNPKSNFGSEVLGYFSATSYDEFEIIVALEK